MIYGGGWDGDNLIQGYNRGGVLDISDSISVSLSRVYYYKMIFCCQLFPNLIEVSKSSMKIWKVIIHLQDLSDLSLTNPIVLVFLFIFALGHS